MEQKQFDELLEKVGKEAADKIKSLFDAQKDGIAKAEDVQALKSQLESLQIKSLEDIKIQGKSLETILKEQGEAIAAKNNQIDVVGNSSVAAQFKSAVEKGQDKWGAMLKKQTPFEIELKSVGTNTRTSVPTAGSNFLPEQQLIAGYVPYRTNAPIMLSVANVVTTSAPVINWVDETAGEGDAGWTAEGAAKPAIDVNATVRNTTVQKIAVTSKVSDEALADISFLGSLIEGRMANKLALKVDDGLLNGDGTSNTPTGLAYYAPAYTSTEMDGTVVNPNKFDALGAAATQITRANFQANTVFINPVDWFTMMHTKDAEQRYVLLSLQMANGSFLNMTAIKSNQVSVGSFIMGDFRYFNVAIREAERFEVGWENDDFTKNLRTMRREMRLASWVSENEKLAFCIDTYANVIDAIGSPIVNP